MVVDLIGIFELKGPYCMLTMIGWFLQALSVIPRGSWDDVARRFTMIRWVSPKMWFRSHKCYRSDLIVDRDYDGATAMDLKPMYTCLKNFFHIIMLSFVNCVDQYDLIVDRDYDGATAMDLKQIFVKCVDRSDLIVDRDYDGATAMDLKPMYTCLKNFFHIIMLSFVNCVDQYDLIVDRDYDGATAMDLKQMKYRSAGETDVSWSDIATWIDHCELVRVRTLRPGCMSYLKSFFGELHNVLSCVVRSGMWCFVVALNHLG
ncbi:hypothetical protein F511_19732 [Dorcoceras hygrometricum]|uniref:Uncharacterized protein n=1 Tax=Dorcoceras hygrometricum TaxID=472368 RepID=A0A2Z7ASK7_9LAMI|nr:hypothetical protein F511_19732 [Dorcoceras hygrometricum]